MVYGLQTLHHQNLIHRDIKYVYSIMLAKYLFPHKTSGMKISLYHLRG